MSGSNKEWAEPPTSLAEMDQKNAELREFWKSATEAERAELNRQFQEMIDRQRARYDEVIRAAGTAKEGR